MPDFQTTLNAWRERDALNSIAPELREFLTVVWVQQTKRTNNPRKHTYTVYSRSKSRPGFVPQELISFMKEMVQIPKDPEFQIEEEFLENYNGQQIGRAFPKITRNDFQVLISHLEGRGLPALGAGFSALDEMNLKKAYTLYLREELCGVFMHYRRNGNQACTERIYLNVKPQAAGQVMRHIVPTMILQPAQYPGLTNCKVAAPGTSSRADSIVMYLSNPAARDAVLDGLAQYQNAGHRDLFNKQTPFCTQVISKHNGIALTGVATGAEPNGQVRRTNVNRIRINPNGIDSFGNFRSTLIEFALEGTVRAGRGENDFVKLVIKLFKWAGLDPLNPSINAPRQ